MPSPSPSLQAAVALQYRSITFNEHLIGRRQMTQAAGVLAFVSAVSVLKTFGSFSPS